MRYIISQKKKNSMYESNAYLRKMFLYYSRLIQSFSGNFRVVFPDKNTAVFYGFITKDCLASGSIDLNRTVHTNHLIYIPSYGKPEDLRHSIKNIASLYENIYYELLQYTLQLSYDAHFYSFRERMICNYVHSQLRKCAIVNTIIDIMLQKGNAGSKQLSFLFSEYIFQCELITNTLIKDGEVDYRIINRYMPSTVFDIEKQEQLKLDDFNFDLWLDSAREDPQYIHEYADWFSSIDPSRMFIDFTGKDLCDMLFCLLYYLFQQNQTVNRCTNCGEIFVPSHGNEKYCCSECRKAGKNRRIVNYYSNDVIHEERSISQLLSMRTLSKSPENVDRARAEFEVYPMSRTILNFRG